MILTCNVYIDNFRDLKITAIGFNCNLYKWYNHATTKKWCLNYVVNGGCLTVFLLFFFSQKKSFTLWPLWCYYIITAYTCMYTFFMQIKWVFLSLNLCLFIDEIRLLSRLLTKRTVYVTYWLIDEWVIAQEYISTILLQIDSIDKFV